jgi:hypothetical protein
VHLRERLRPLPMGVREMNQGGLSTGVMGGRTEAYPANRTELHELVASMRELGVLQAFGVVLGPPPPPPQTNEERVTSAREQRIAEARQAMRDTLAASMPNASNATLDKLIDPSVFEGE